MVVFTMAEVLAKDAEQPAPRCDLDYWAELNLSMCLSYGDLACERQQRTVGSLPSALQA